MKTPSTQKVVEHIVNDYRRAGKVLARTAEHVGTTGFMTEDSMDADADAIEAAYQAGKFDTIPASELDSYMEKYGATDIYHLTATYFTQTGKILKVEE